MPKELLLPVEKIEIFNEDTGITTDTYYPVDYVVYDDGQLIFFKVPDGTNWTWYKSCTKIFYRNEKEAKEA